MREKTKWWFNGDDSGGKGRLYFLYPKPFTRSTVYKPSASDTVRAFPLIWSLEPYSSVQLPSGRTIKLLDVTTLDDEVLTNKIDGLRLTISNEYADKRTYEDAINKKVTEFILEAAELLRINKPKQIKSLVNAYLDNPSTASGADQKWKELINTEAIRHAPEDEESQKDFKRRVNRLPFAIYELDSDSPPDLRIVLPTRKIKVAVGEEYRVLVYANPRKTGVEGEEITLHEAIVIERDY